MIRKSVFVCLITLLLATAAGSIPVPDTVFIVDGKKISVSYPLEFRPSDVLVWVGDLVKFGWVSGEKLDKGTLIIRHRTTTLTFRNGKTEVSVGNLAIQSDTAPEIISGHFYVPLAFTCRALGFDYGVRNALVIESNTVSNDDGPTQTGKNSICGKTLYNGHPIAGIKVRAVTDQDVFVPHALAVTDKEGSYIFKDLPDGSFRPFVYVGDNPDYFNRDGDLVALSDGSTARANLIRLGRILSAECPLPGGEVVLTGSKIKLCWSECPEALRYRITVEEATSGNTVVDQTVTTNSAFVSAKTLKCGILYKWAVTAKGDGGKSIGGSPASGKTLWTFRLKH